MTVALFAIAGTFAGALQSALLRRAVRSGAHPLGALVRLSIAAGALVAAAFLGHVLAVASGWAFGFGVSTLLFARRWS